MQWHVFPFTEGNDGLTHTLIDGFNNRNTLVNLNRHTRSPKALLKLSTSPDLKSLLCMGTGLTGRPERSRDPQVVAKLINLMVERGLSHCCAKAQIATPTGLKDFVCEKLALKIQPIAMCLNKQQEKYTA